MDSLSCIARCERVSINIDDLASEINRQLAQYAQHTDEKIQELAKEIANKGTEKLKQVSPKDTGDYRKGWKVKRVGKKFIIHNATNYQLTHLLEKGHAKSGGGRVAPRVHIKPVEEQMIGEFESGIEGVVQG